MSCSKEEAECGALDLFARLKGKSDARIRLRNGGWRNGHAFWSSPHGNAFLKHTARGKIERIRQPTTALFGGVHVVVRCGKSKIDGISWGNQLYDRDGTSERAVLRSVKNIEVVIGASTFSEDGDPASLFHLDAEKQSCGG